MSAPTYAAGRPQAPYEVVGTVVRLVNVGEAHRLVEVLSDGAGRCSALARHARASRRRFGGGVLEPFVTLRLHLLKGRGRLPTLSAADVLDARMGLRRSWEALRRAGLLCACARTLVPEGQSNPAVLAALHRGLDDLTAGDVHGACSVWLPMLQAGGVLPALNCCAACHIPGADLQPSPGRVGLYCQRCAAQPVHLTAAVRQALQGGPITTAELAQAVEQQALTWLSVHAGVPAMGSAGETLPG